MALYGKDSITNGKITTVWGEYQLQRENPSERGAYESGEGGIRTRGTRERTHAFQACAFSRSATSPNVKKSIYNEREKSV
tara:strand:- start:103 stop:342 length:240 start_codon:yes stop_codon:yes gene_type:complete